MTTPQPAALPENACPKCGAISGNDWSQCNGSCPMYGSPHFKPNAKANRDGLPELNPAEIVVDVVCKALGGFAPVNTNGVRVTHKPSGVSVTVDSERSQHKNKHLAWEKLRAILAALQPQPAAAVSDAEWWHGVLGSAGPDLLNLAKQWSDNEVHVYQFVNEAEKIVKAAAQRAIPALRPQAVPMPEPVQRLRRYAGQTMRTARNPNITAREAIEIGDYLAAIGITAQGAQGGEG